MERTVGMACAKVLRQEESLRRRSQGEVGEIQDTKVLGGVEIKYMLLL